MLVTRLNSIGWHWERNTFIDQDGLPINVWECPIQELKMRLQQAWQTRCLHLLSERKTFGGMQTMSPTLTMRVQPADAGERGLLHSSLNGTFFTADHAVHLDETADNKCPFCSQPDSQTHRQWECPELESARTLTTEMRQRILSQPPATFNHGWVPAPTSLPLFQQMLQNVPDQTREHTLPLIIPHTLDFFTDGSCMDAGDALSRIAGWGTVIFTPDAQEEFFTVSSGLVSGLLQTVNRAELTAAISALALAHRLQRPFRIWVDSAVVHKALTRAHQSSQTPYTYNNKTSNHDLLNELSTLAYHTRSLCIGIIKLYSHQPQTADAGWVDNWSSRGNDAADKAASLAFASHPAVLRVWQALRQEITDLQTLRNSLRATIVAVGKLAQQKKLDRTKEAKQDEAETDRTVIPRVFEDWQFDIDREELQFFACEDITVLPEWMESLRKKDAPIQHWSWQQLFIDIRLRYPGFGPWYYINKSRREWKCGTESDNQNFNKRCKWFRSWLTKLADAAGSPLPIKFLRPNSHVYTYWTPCLAVRADASRCEAIDRWLLQWAPMYKAQKDMRQIHGMP